jgi:hypothetical protein
VAQRRTSKELDTKYGVNTTKVMHRKAYIADIFVAINNGETLSRLKHKIQENEWHQSSPHRRMQGRIYPCAAAPSSSYTTVLTWKRRLRTDCSFVCTLI